MDYHAAVANGRFPPIRDVHGNRRQVFSDRQVTTHRGRSLGGHKKTVSVEDALLARMIDGISRWRDFIAGRTYGVKWSNHSGAIAAFVKCQTKAYLLASEEPTRDSYFAEMATRVSSTYKNIASRQPPVDSGRSAFRSFSQFSRDRDCNIVNYHVD